jgi:hypothetical protein
MDWMDTWEFQNGDFLEDEVHHMKGEALIVITLLWQFGDSDQIPSHCHFDELILPVIHMEHRNL